MVAILGRGGVGALAGAIGSLVLAGSAQAQARESCKAPAPPYVGAAIGLSDPYLELRSNLPSIPRGSFASRGPEIAGRADVPLIGPLRARIEGAAAWWDVRQDIYASTGTMSGRHLVGVVRAMMGRAPACGYVLAGGGLYSMSAAGVTLRRPGWTIGFGFEVPLPSRQLIQIEATLHMVLIGQRAPLAAMTASPVVTLQAGWARRF